MTHDRKGPVTQLKEQVEESVGSCKELEKDYLRALADFDNYRKRVERDSEQSRRLALERLIMDLLPVLDNFDRAVQAAGDGHEADSVRTGMELIQRQLRDALCKHGLTEYSCLGSQFDPRKAEAISFVHTDQHKPGTVVSEVCKGYACGERVLRPARVVVSKEPSRPVEKESSGPGQAAETEGQDSESASAETRSRKRGSKGQGSDMETGQIAEPDGESKG
jgi:molecular chaperone GrpE